MHIQGGGEGQSKRRHTVSHVPVGDVFIVSDTVVALQQETQGVLGQSVRRENILPPFPELLVFFLSCFLSS